jgi:ubiquinone/menaquinone biosynthesis C-methylase UbiE
MALDSAEFDRFADEYEQLHRANIRISGEAPEFFISYKVADVARSLAGSPRQVASILDFGSGVGSSVPYFNQHFPNARIYCIDVSARSLKISKTRFPEQAVRIAFDGERLPFPDQALDVAFAACVFHHIPHELHVSLLREIRRVLRPAGRMFVFEHNPFNPLTVHAVNTCPFDENAKLIAAPRMRERMRAAGFKNVGAAYRIFFPRALAMLRPLESRLKWLPLGAQYYVEGQA